ncbi:MAG: hypothetical protein PHE60_09615 [Sulfurospirillaceae bacterium]|nr:hypothetical protein [Sulfurospirillaceae bacterium]
MLSAQEEKRHMQLQALALDFASNGELKITPMLLSLGDKVNADNGGDTLPSYLPHSLAR